VSVTALPSHVQELADQAASSHGVEVLELKLRGRGRGQVLSVMLDADEPVEADVVERVSRDLSRALGRPLHSARDFRRQRGHEVSIVRGGGDPGTETVQGVVVAADDEAVTLDVDGSQLRVPLSDVVRGKVVLPW
jgi:ribosome maturation factor RimP